MLGRIIEWSARNVFLVLLATLFVVAAGVYAVLHTPLDALPDLSDVQVIIYTEYPGQAPQVVEDQVTYPADHGHAGGAQVQGGARLLVLRRLVRLRHLRGRHRHLLGALARAGIPQLRLRAHAARASRRRWGRTRPAWAGCTSTPCSAAKQDAGRTAHHPGLVSCATSSPRRRAWPKWRASAASSRHYQVTVDPRKLQAYGIPLMKVARGDPRLATATSAAARSRWRRPNTWCAAAAICAACPTSRTWW